MHLSGLRERGEFHNKSIFFLENRRVIIVACGIYRSVVGVSVDSTSNVIRINIRVDVWDLLWADHSTVFAKTFSQGIPTSKKDRSSVVALSTQNLYQICLLELLESFVGSGDSEAPMSFEPRGHASFFLQLREVLQWLGVKFSFCEGPFEGIHHASRVPCRSRC